MKKIVMLLVMMALATPALAFDTNILGVVEGGNISAKTNYFYFAGENPYFENRFISSYSGHGTVGLAVQNSFSGSILTKEQMEVQTGFGHFLSKAGASVLTNLVNEETGVVSGTLAQSAVGFGGFLKNGSIVTSGFSTENGLTGVAEVQGIGSFRAGAIKHIQIGTNEPGMEPSTVEYYEGHWSFGPGAYQAKVEIIFPY